MSNKIYTESYPCSNIIDNTNITNSLEYLEYHSLIEKNNTKDMIKLNKKLNDHYGKYNKSLESYLINNANTSKENYNNYINNNKELYNELMMSREDAFGLALVGGSLLFIGGVILVNMIKDSINKKNAKKLVESILKDPKMKKMLQLFVSDISELNKNIWDVFKNLNDKHKIGDDIKKKFKFPDDSDGFLFINSPIFKNKALKESEIFNKIISDLLKNGSPDKSKFFSTKSFVSIGFNTQGHETDNDKDADIQYEKYEKIFKSMDSGKDEMKKYIESLFKSYIKRNFELIYSEKIDDDGMFWLNYDIKLSLKTDYNELFEFIKKK